MVAASLDNMHNTIVVWPSQKSSILFRTSIPPPEAERGGVNLKLNQTDGVQIEIRHSSEISHLET
jgi:hypothetical protein